jgi:PAS domain S-box-containing protein
LYPFGGFLFPSPNDSGYLEIHLISGGDLSHRGKESVIGSIMIANNIVSDNLGLRLIKIDNELAECKTSEKSLREIIKTLREERDFLIKAISAVYHPFYVLDANSYKIVMANTAAENLYGDRCVNTLCYSWTHGRSTPCSDDNHPCPLKIIRNKKIPVTLDHTHYDKMGRPLYFEIHAYPIFDERGNIDKIVEYSLESTAFRRMEAAYKESEVRYEEIVENAHDIIQSILPDGSLAYVNRAWYEIMGYSEINLHSINFFDIVHPYSLKHCKEVFYRVLEGKSGTHIPISFVAKNGKQIFVEGNIRPHFIDGKVVSAHGIFRDLTESIKADEALRENEKQLLKYSKHLERIIASLNVAKEVQQSLLPQNMPSQTGIDIAGSILYCDETGGDYYDFFKLPNIGVDAYGIAVGDASGHGISSTLHMASVRAYLRSCATQRTSACKIISEVNRLFLKDTMESGNFMTLFFS